MLQRRKYQYSVCSISTLFASSCCFFDQIMHGRGVNSHPFCTKRAGRRTNCEVTGRLAWSRGSAPRPGGAVRSKVLGNATRCLLRKAPRWPEQLLAVSTPPARRSVSAGVAPQASIRNPRPCRHRRHHQAEGEEDVSVRPGDRKRRGERGGLSAASPVHQIPPSALTSNTLASIWRRSRSIAMRSFINAVLCAVTTSR